MEDFLGIIEFNEKYPCIICTYKGTKCSTECEYNKHFPNRQAVEFKIATKLFGRKNLRKMIKSVDPKDRVTAGRSIRDETMLWVTDPEKGPYGIAQNLKHQIEVHEKELKRVNTLLQSCKTTTQEKKCETSRSSHTVNMDAMIQDHSNKERVEPKDQLPNVPHMIRLNDECETAELNLWEYHYYQHENMKVQEQVIKKIVSSCANGTEV